MTVPYDFARPVTTSFNLYARFVLRSKTITCRDVKIKALANAYDNDESVVLSLIGFDYDYLEKNGMGLQFNIVYDVRYTKDYHVPFDIGYAGAPQYKLSLINSSLQGYSEEKISAAGMWQGRTLSYNTPLMFSQGNQVELLFSTDNVQNILSFSNIVVTIEAIKLR